MYKKKSDNNRGRKRSFKNRGSSSPQGKRGSGQPVLDMSEPVRLNRFIARSGTCSRRDADELIAKGLVQVNGKVISEMGVKVKDGDRVSVNGKQIVPTDREYVLMNKPRDTITTTDDEKGRQSVIDLLDPEQFGSIGLFPVGRLDRHTTGALVLTNDGDLAHRLMHPSFGVAKQYLVEVTDEVSDEQLDTLRNGIELEDGLAKADRVSFAHGESKRWLIMAIHEGRNRQVRRMIEALNNRVKSLDRMRYAGLTTKGIRKGKWRRLTRPEVAALYKSVKL